jgi:hypothetical protein
LTAYWGFSCRPPRIDPSSAFQRKVLEVLRSRPKWQQAERNGRFSGKKGADCKKGEGITPSPFWVAKTSTSQGPLWSFGSLLFFLFRSAGAHRSRFRRWSHRSRLTSRGRGGWSRRRWGWLFLLSAACNGQRSDQQSRTRPHEEPLSHPCHLLSLVSCDANFRQCKIKRFIVFHNLGRLASETPSHPHPA